MFPCSPAETPVGERSLEARWMRELELPSSSNSDKKEWTPSAALTNPHELPLCKRESFPEWNDVNCRNTNEMNVRSSPKKVFRGFNRIRTAMVTHSFHWYSRSSHHFICVSFLSRVDELNKLGGSSVSSAQTTAARTQRPRVRIPVEAPKTFFGLLRNCLNCDLTARRVAAYKSGKHWLTSFLLKFRKKSS